MTQQEWTPTPEDLARLALLSQWLRCDRDALRLAITRRSLLMLDNLGVTVHGVYAESGALLANIYAQYA